MAFRATTLSGSLCTSTSFQTPDTLRASVSGSGKAIFAHRSLHQACIRHPARLRGKHILRRAHDGHGSSRDPSLEDYVEVKVDSVRVAQGSSVVSLRILEGEGAILPVHIGESESNALMSEISNQKNRRPLTHDVMKNMLLKIGYRVNKIRITQIVSNTYYARIHLTLNRPNGDSEDVDVDARPSDAINLAVRFGAPMYVNKQVAAIAAQVPQTQVYSAQSETHADILKSIRETIAAYEDPTVMYQLEKDLAVRQERFEDAQNFHNKINDEMTRNPELRLIVAMEAAAADGRFEEAARLRDEFNRHIQGRVTERK